MTKNGKKSPFRWQHIKVIGRITMDWDNAILSRYMRYRYAKDLFKKVGKACFISPKKWEDPFEKRFYDISIDSDQNPIKYGMACYCMTSSPIENSSAFWERAKDDEDFWVRLDFDLCRFLDNLELFAAENHCRFYLSQVNYDLTEKEIVNGHRNPKIIKGDLEETYVRLMSLKRRAFKFENEYRIFAIWDKSNKIAVKDDILEVSIQNTKGLIKSITIDPWQHESRKIQLITELNLAKTKENTKKLKNNLKECMKQENLKIGLYSSGLNRSKKCTALVFPLTRVKKE